MYLSIVLALIAAASNAASNIMQRLANKEEQDVGTLSLRLVKDLLHRPLWFGGIGAVTLSFLLQASALRFGPLAMVEPLLVCELPLTFVGVMLVMKAPLGRREWSAAAVMTLGLAGLIFFLDPHGSHTEASWLGWLVGLGSSEGAVAALVAAGWRTQGDVRAALYGAATGIQFGTTAALMNGAVVNVSHPAVLFTSWETYAMVAAGILGMFLMQNAMQAGKILAAQPGITLLDPIIAILWGLLAFHEQVTNSGTDIALSAAGGILMVVGGLILTRSPILDHSGSSTSEDASGTQARSEGALSR